MTPEDRDQTNQGPENAASVRIEEALALHRAGELEAAERLYGQVLEAAPDHPDGLHLLGLVRRQTGKPEEALDLIDRAISRNPGVALYHNNRGYVLQDLGRTAEALAAYDEALRLDEGNAEAHNNRGNTLAMDGRLGDALAAYDRALALDPGYAEAHYNRANALAALGRTADALAGFDAALASRPDLAEAHNNRGNVLKTLGRLDEAVAAFDEALRLVPDAAVAHVNRGAVLQRLGRLEQALEAVDAAVRLAPALAEAHNNRGTVLRDLGRLDEAVEAFRHALELQPGYAEAEANRASALLALGRNQAALAAVDAAIALNPNLAEAHAIRGAALTQLDRLDEALAAVDAALRLAPNYAEAHNNRGTVLAKQWHLGDALAALDQALRLDPGYAEAHYNRGNVLKDQARVDEAVAAYRQALQAAPNHQSAYHNLLFCMNYAPMVDNAAIFQESQRWGQTHGRPPAVLADHRNKKDPDRPLDVGLVSADFCHHPTGYFLDGVLAAHDRSRLRFHGYSQGAKTDDLTERLRAACQSWREVATLDDPALAEAIRSDGIDILIDLSGHTGGTRLTCFAHRPAPLQITWLGSCHTTGLPAMDHILMDPTYVAEGDERWFTETVVRLPEIRWCYAPPHYLPPVADPPVLKNGAITFGSFNNLTKVNPRVIALWARLLEAVPDARLMLNWRTLADPGECARIKTSFLALGIQPDRLILTEGPGPHEQVLASYGDVDIALDPFPFTGCLTTFEALVMGVPVVTLPGSRPASRQSLGILSALGRRDWVARDAADYVRIAAGLAADPQALAAVRRELRPALTASPACDGPRMARDLEHLLRQLWRDWCATQAAD